MAVALFLSSLAKAAETALRAEKMHFNSHFATDSNAFQFFYRVHRGSAFKLKLITRGKKIKRTKEIEKSLISYRSFMNNENFR